GALLTGLELALNVSNRIKAYTQFHAQLPPSSNSGNLRISLVRLLFHVLEFLARAIRYYSNSSVSKVARALQDSGSVLEFENICRRLCDVVDHDASICDRDVERDWRIELDKKLRSLDMIQDLHAKVSDLCDKMDLVKLDLALDHAKGATYDSSTEGDLPRCLPGTRVELLCQISSWARDRNGKRIFWLCGKAGTGKSTISRTVAESLNEDHLLGATFFFRRGQASRSHAGLFFPTIAIQLADKFPHLGHAIAAALRKDSLLREGYLVKQFEGLLLRPMQEAFQGNPPVKDIVLVIDALDECENEEEVSIILKLLKRIEDINTARVRIFVTSRPDLSVLEAFQNVTKDFFQDIWLEEAQAMSIRSDLHIFFDHEFSQIQERRRTRHYFSNPLPEQWPGQGDIRLLVDRAHPLFIVASTLCRYISKAKKPHEQLQRFLTQQREYGSLTGLTATYLPILKQATSADTEQQQNENIIAFQAIIGPLALLCDPLSSVALSELLEVDIDDIGTLLPSLLSVLSVSESAENKPDPHASITLFHLSFRDFLLDPEVGDPETKHRSVFWLDEAKTHKRLAKKCLRLLSTNTLKQNLCDVLAPGTRRSEVSKSQIDDSLSDAVIYACCYWVQHTVDSRENLLDDGQEHNFLKKHLLHWMEAVCWLGKLSDIIHSIKKLQSIVDVSRYS
ncbi:hypothetical protein K431DRAFT_236238, partial [Polychaeton citri CBS 116435]